jgi:hypothetical protein
MGRLADALRKRLRAGGAGAPPATLPGVESGEQAAVAAAAKPAPEPVSEPAPEPVSEPAPASGPDAGARIDAARERLRARIEPPDPDAG